MAKFLGPIAFILYAFSISVSHRSTAVCAAQFITTSGLFDNITSFTLSISTIFNSSLSVSISSYSLFPVSCLVNYNTNCPLLPVINIFIIYI